MGKLKKLKLDTVISINTLEHIKNDSQAMNNISKLLSPGGRVLLFVPALRFLYGSVDKEFGHFRRYNKKELIKLLVKNGFTIEKAVYFNMVGIFWWFITGKILKVSNLPKNTGAILKIVVPVVSRIEKCIPAPLGQSLIIIARKEII